ncbi:MFS transporter [Nocardioides marmoribigeumensis]|uniref:EmrB/QacA subfamily drug resistance transporter n=1 Tax=Nocardioides marmoribigeumensis TaxID=433649 RepID=A0ABU2BW25_9ACTN|nr:MFS transporter [Nocardioides marmoribigeumensis]MDR7362827.1 EmrB/QacA subfamily drug resistance transporter [Nocardioides marmoribigeumensis]
MRGSTGVGQGAPDPARWRILGVTLTVGFMVLLDVTIVNVAIPSMRSALETSAGSIQWVVSGYALTFGLTLVTGGRLGDAYGRRRMMLIGLAGFIAASAAAGLAPSIGVLVAARLVQGCAAGLLTPQNSGLIQTLFKGPERGTAFGLFGLTVSVSSAVGPVLGGLIIALVGPDSGWRWIFLVNVPIGLVLLVAIRAMVPGRDPDGDGDTRLDLVGALLLGLTVLLVLFPVVRVEGGSRTPLLLLLLVPVLTTGFVRWERRVVRRGGAPLLDIGLLRQVPGYASGIVVGTLYFTGFTGIFLVLSVYLQDGVDRTALATGLLLVPFAVGSAVASPVAGRVVSRIGRRVTVGALLVMISGILSVTLMVPPVGGGRWLWLVLGVPLLVAGLGGGAVVSPNFTLTLADVPTRMGGAAGGAVQTGQRIGASIGAAVVMTTYQVALSSYDDPGVALRWALSFSLVVLTTALGAAVWSWRYDPESSVTVRP